MPLYEYRCLRCGTSIEEIQEMGAGPPGACRECGGPLKRVYGRVAVRFSGWGFKSTDKLLPEGRPRRGFKQLAERAEEIAEG